MDSNGSDRKPSAILMAESIEAFGATFESDAPNRRLRPFRDRPRPAKNSPGA